MHISCYNLNNMDIVSLEFGDLDVIAGGLQEQLPPIVNINKETRWGIQLKVFLKKLLRR